MKYFHRQFLIIMVLLAWCPQAEAVCSTVSVSTIGLAFGNYDPASAVPTYTTGNISIICTGIAGANSAYTIGLGGILSGNSLRYMTSASGSLLKYNIYEDVARSIVWGSGQGNTQLVTDSYTLTTANIPYNYPIYGAILAMQNVSVGVYYDVINVIVNF